VVLSVSVGGSDGAQGIVRLFDDTISKLLAALKYERHSSFDTSAILVPALVAGFYSMVAISLVPLGRRCLVRRGFVLIDLAIAQVAGTRRDASASRFSNCPSNGWE
jgi:hypothetical protein